MRVFLLRGSRQHFLHDYLVVRQRFVDGRPLQIGRGVGFQAFYHLEVARLFFECPHKRPKIVLHVLFETKIFLFFLLFYDLPLSLLLLHCGVGSKFQFHLGLLDEEVEHRG